MLRLVPLAWENPANGGSSETAIPSIPDARAEQTARALATSPYWASVPNAALVLRRAPTAALGILGCFDAATEERLRALIDQLKEPLPTLVSYRDVEDACESLTERLIERFGVAKIRRMRFTALPRGGLIALGLLAYRLDLDPGQLEPTGDHRIPVVVVDDCAITGFRFGQWLGRKDAERVIFAPLYAHPDLAPAIEAQERRVVACVAARPLLDLAPERLGDEYESWRKERLDQPGVRRYWVGQIDRIAFPWSTPGAMFWNSVTGRMERAWDIVPPHHSLRNRPGAAIPAIPIQVQSGRGEWLRTSDSVLFGDGGDGDIVVGDMATGQGVTLRGSGALLWKLALTTASRERAIATLEDRYDATHDQLAAELDGFVEQMISRGLLQRSST